MAVTDDTRYARWRTVYRLLRRADRESQRCEMIRVCLPHMPSRGAHLTESLIVDTARAGTLLADLCVQDERLIRGCQNGDRAAWEALIGRHAERVYGMCYRFTRRHSDAEDMTQETFLRVFVRLGTFRANQLSFISWLTTLTQNLLIDRYRRAHTDRRTVSIDEERFNATRPGRAGDPEQELLRREQRQLVRSELQKLAPQVREVIELCHIEEFRCCEVAQRLGIPEGTVKSRLNRGLTNLRRRLRTTRVGGGFGKEVMK